MDRNTLLNSSRAQFLTVFGQIMHSAIMRSSEKLYEKADKSKSSQVQRQLLDARSTLMIHEAELSKLIESKLAGLIERSFQTAYDKFRPSFFKAGNGNSMALMDITAFEDELRVDIITNRFRSEAEEQLRDLNIRIAILFERNDIAERENPFRPYLLTRCLVLGIEAINVDAETVVILTDQLAEELVSGISTLYESVNEHLSECGVAAQLQFKSKSMPADLTNPVGYDPESNAEDALASDTLSTQIAARHAPASSSAPAARSRVGKIEQLIQMVRQKNTQQMAASHGGGPQGIEGGESAGGYDEGAVSGHGSVGNEAGYGGGNGVMYGAGAPSNSPAGAVGQLFSQAGSAMSGWLEGAQEMGDTLRRVFRGGTQSARSGSGQVVAGGDSGQEYDGDAGSAMASESGSGVASGSEAEDDSVQAAETSQLIAISPQLNQALRVPIPATQDMMGLDGEVRNLIIERRDNLNSLAADQHEKMTIDIVAMLFEFILKDHQVPAEVRAQLGRLQFSVLKMALMDSALLTKKSHPARLLVNRIGSISVSLQQIDPTGERISTEICRIVEELLASDSENPELFSRMLDQLDVFIARELLASNANMERVVKVVVSAEQRSQRYNQASARLEKMLDGMVITPYLRRFLIDTWSHVIERVERNSTAGSTRFRLLVPNLLWSILPKANRDDRSMLLQLIPALVPVLREGMGLVAWLPEHQQELLNWLVDAHTTVMRAVASSENVVTLAEVQRHFHDFVYPSEAEVVAPVAHKVTVNRALLDEAIRELETELQEVGLLQDLDMTPELVGVSKEEIEAPDQSEQAEALDGDSVDADAHMEAFMQDQEKPAEPAKEVDILDRLRSGVVVEINLSGKPTRGRLNWISPNSSNLILTITGQEAPSIISVRMFRRMLKNERARFVEVAPLFERAVQSLLESADQLDLANAD